MTQQPPDREAIARDKILGALARAYCREPNTNKELDADLIKAMADELDAILSSFPVGVGQTRPQIESLPANESANAKSEILDER